MLTAYNQVSIPAFMYGTAWKKDATTELVQQAVAAAFHRLLAHPDFSNVLPGLIADPDRAGLHQQAEDRQAPVMAQGGEHVDSGFRFHISNMIELLDSSMTLFGVARDRVSRPRP